MEEALRRGLAEAVGRIEPGADGLERIRARIGGRPPRPWLLTVGADTLDAARHWVWRGHWSWHWSWAWPTALPAARPRCPVPRLSLPGAGLSCRGCRGCRCPGYGGCRGRASCSGWARPGPGAPLPWSTSAGCGRWRAGRDRDHRQRLVRRAALPPGDHPGEQHRLERPSQPPAAARAPTATARRRATEPARRVPARRRPARTAPTRGAGATSSSGAARHRARPRPRAARQPSRRP